MTKAFIVRQEFNNFQQIAASRIIGGEIAEDGVAPFQCSLQVDKEHHCGCSVISHKFIVTAAHCTHE